MHGFLLDTQVLLWLVNEPAKLTDKAKNIILNSNNRLYYSLLSMNEIAIKASIGKLKMIADWQSKYEKEYADNCIEILPLNWQMIDVLQHLPFHHKDPFDRMLIAQAITNNLAFISSDGHCAKYDLEVIW